MLCNACGVAYTWQPVESATMIVKLHVHHFITNRS